jgi:hypothetical protein
MRLGALFSLVIFMCSCVQNRQSITTPTASKSDSAPPISDTTSYFNLLNATSEPWVAGIRGGGSGIEHSFQIFVTSDEKLIFEKVWMKENVFDVFVSKNQEAITSDPVQYTKNEVITVRVSEFQSVNNEKILPPIQYDGEALIGFKANGQQKYFIVKEIKKLPTLYRQ